VPYICRSQINSTELLTLYAVDDDGILYDPETVEFRIWDRTGNVQVFPATGYEDVTTVGRFGVGSFRAYDTGTSDGWAPASGATIGPYRIDWRFTDSVDETITRTWSQRFDVVDVGLELGYWTYLSPSRVRAEGVDSGMLPDDRLLDLIVRAQQYIERECRQAFRPIRQTLKFDGNGGVMIPFSIPIIGVEAVYVNDSDTELPTTSYAVYAYPSLKSDPGPRSPDSRRNPKITMKTRASASPFRPGGVFLASPLAGRLLPGPQMHQVPGVYGFLEADGTTPKLIEDAMLRVVLATAVMMDIGPGNQGGSVSGPITSEKTDQHEISYGFSYTAGSSDSPLATSPEVLEILRRYRAPIGIASPASRF